MSFHLHISNCCAVIISEHGVITFYRNSSPQPDSNNETDVEIRVIKGLADNKVLINEKSNKTRNKEKHKHKHALKPKRKI